MQTKVVLLTGASAGLGKNMAKCLLQRNYIVYCAARRIEFMADLASLGGKIIKLDVSDKASCDNTIKTIMREHSRLHILINNAGYGCFGSIEEVSYEESKRQFDVNVFGLAYLMKLALPIMREQKAGRIINLSSMAGLFSLPMMGWYSASKYAVEALSDAVRLESYHQNIKVSLIEPGPTKSDFSKVALADFSADKVLPVYSHLAAKLNKRKSAFSSVGEETVTLCVLDAIESNKPKSRYIPTKKFATIALLRKLLPARLLEFFIVKLFS